MSKYEWDINSINNIQNDDIKNIVMSEYQGLISTNDSVVYKILSVKDFKANYFECLRKLKNYNNELATISNLLPYTLIGKNITNYVYPHQNFTADIVIEIIKSFIITLNDPELLNYFNTLTNPDNHILRIQEYNPDIPITEYIRGRLIHQDDISYVSYYLQDNITDITCLTHEISHYFATKIKNNPHFKSFFTEFEAKMMEYMCIRYITEKLDDLDLGIMMMQDEINSIITDIHITFYQRLVANSLSNKYNEEKIQKRFNKELHLFASPPPKSLILNNKVNDTKARIHSALLALALTNKLDNDYEQGATIYKSILRDPELNFEKLLKKYNLDYQEYVDTFAHYLNPDYLKKQLKK